MPIKIYKDLIQGSDEWLAARCGLLTASEVKLILTPTLKNAKNDKQRAHVFEIAAQRITGFTEPAYINDDMLRGHHDEVLARRKYEEERIEIVENVGFITSDDLGFLIGYSPDGLIGEDGLVEIKSRRQKLQIETILNNAVPEEHWLQVQTGLMVTGRKWIDYISYCAGLPMCVIRVYPDDETIAAIKEAAIAFEDSVSEMVKKYNDMLSDKAYSLYPTERDEKGVIIV